MWFQFGFSLVGVWRPYDDSRFEHVSGVEAVVRRGILCTWTELGEGIGRRSSYLQFSAFTKICRLVLVTRNLPCPIRRSYSSKLCLNTTAHVV